MYTVKDPDYWSIGDVRFNTFPEGKCMECGNCVRIDNGVHTYKCIGASDSTAARKARNENISRSCERFKPKSSGGSFLQRLFG
jgi:hypothetical protein